MTAVLILSAVITSNVSQWWTWMSSTLRLLNSAQATVWLGTTQLCASLNNKSEQSSYIQRHAPHDSSDLLLHVLGWGVTEGCTLDVGEVQRHMIQGYAVSKIITHKELTPTHFLRLQYPAWNKVKLSLWSINWAPRHEDVWGNGSVNLSWPRH
jgi:hypothetical protein